MTGDAYENWVAGIDVGTGRPKGHLRDDANALRFVGVTVSGPKTWSLAAALLHPEVSAALDAAQDRAAEQIIGWVAQYATTRVGPRGQVQVPVEQIEAAAFRHHTSRAGNPTANSTCRSTLARCDAGSSHSARVEHPARNLVGRPVAHSRGDLLDILGYAERPAHPSPERGEAGLDSHSALVRGLGLSHPRSVHPVPLDDVLVAGVGASGTSNHAPAYRRSTSTSTGSSPAVCSGWDAAHPLTAKAAAARTGNGVDTSPSPVQVREPSGTGVCPMPSNMRSANHRVSSGPPLRTR